MKIAVNTQFLTKKFDGIGWFTYESLKRIVRAHPEVEFYFIFDDVYDKDCIFGDNVHPVIIRPTSRNPLFWFIRFHFLIPLYLLFNKVDLYLSPDGFVAWPVFSKKVQVLHDINFIHQPKNIKIFSRIYLNFFFPFYARCANRIATVSEFSKKDISDTLKIDSARIDVVYNGANESFRELIPEEIERVKKEYTNGKPFFVFIGTLHPRKNILHLLKAFDDFSFEVQDDFYMVIVGSKLWWTDELEEAYQNMQYKHRVVFTGRVDSEKLPLILGSAYALTYVSFYEGFGIPLVEAMNAGIPIITSNCTSMPEVGGDAALYADPYSVSSIKEAMIALANNPQMRDDLIEKGRVRRKLFAWDKTAQALWLSIEKTINQLC